MIIFMFVCMSAFHDMYTLFFLVIEMTGFKAYYVCFKLSPLLHCKPVSLLCNSATYLHSQLPHFRSFLLP